MDKGRVRDKNGRFRKVHQSSRSVQHTNSADMSADKRPHTSETVQDSSKISSPSTSPRRKKNLADDTASWRSSPNFSADFYPQYMRKTHSPAPQSSPLSGSNHSTDRVAGESSISSPASRQGSATPPQEESKGESNRELSSNTSIREYQSNSEDDRSAHNCSYRPVSHFDTMTQSTEEKDQINSNNNSSVQTFDQIPKAGTNQNNIRCLAHANGQFIHTADLEEVMSRAMSKVMVQLQTITSDLKQVPAIKATTAKLDKEMIKVRQDCYGIKESVKELRQKEEENSSKNEALARELNEIKSKLEDSTGQTGVNNQKQPSKAPQSELDSLKREATARQANLIIEGIPEPADEPDTDMTTEKQVISFFAETLSLPKFEIASAFRLGRPRSGSALPRPIKVKFLRPIEREWVWRAKAVLAKNRDTTFGIKEDLPPKLRTMMSALIRVSQTARRYPDMYHSVMIRDFQIFINGSAYAPNELESLPSNLRPSVTSTPGNIYVVVFYGRDSKFSNHYQCRFTWDNKEFSSVEQYLAFRRAGMAGRKDLSNQVMRTQDPADAKRIMNTLRQAKSEPTWVEQRKDILFSGLMAKYSQNEHLMNYLLKSEERKLGEASTDTTWGIGLSLTDHSVLNPTMWRGENLQGITLMEVRKELSAMAGEDTPHSSD